MKRWLPLAAGVALLVIVLLRTAWLCDDAFFTFRTVENWLAGFGPRWNVDDRAQAYTHPLWMLLLTASSALTGEIEGSAIGLGVVCGVGTFVVLAWGQRPEVVTGIAMALAGSKAWTDFATSGLENSLSGLLVACFARLWLKAPSRLWLRGPSPWTPAVALLAGLLVLNRLDLLVVVLPVLWIQGRRRRSAWPLALAALPVAVWLLFALVYYGSPLPTPALAKLALGASRATLLEHGLWYLIEPLQLDWITLPLLVTGLAVGLLPRGHDRAPALAAGGALYLLYVVWIGGDFMSGRFHVVPYVLAVALLSHRVAAWSPARIRVGAFALALLALASPRSPYLSGPHYGASDDPWSRPYVIHHGVLDERAFYYPRSGLLRGTEREPPAARLGTRRVEVGYFGEIPYQKGPMLHRIDPQALADPLLARLPVPKEDLRTFRAGHAARILPAEYVASWDHRANMFTDPVLRPLYADVILATQAPLLAPGRAGAITRLLLHDLVRLARGAPLVAPEAIEHPWTAPVASP